MSDQNIATIARAAIDTYQTQIREHGNQNVAIKHAQEHARTHPAAAKIDRDHVTHVAIDAVLEYRRQARDMPHDQARDQAVYRLVTPGKEAGLDIKNYARSVIDSVQSHPRDKAAVLGAHASIAADEGRAPSDKAYAIATKAHTHYQTAREAGMNHDQARERVAQYMGQRYDARGDRKPGLDVEAYTKNVIEAHRRNPGEAAKTIAEQAKLVAAHQNVSIKDATNIAQSAVLKYTAQINRENTPQQAKTTVVQQMAQRFDSRGKSLKQEHGLSR